MSLARAKLLGGTEDACAKLDECPPEALAILGIRVCLELVPQCQLSHDLAAQHMRTLYHISDSRGPGLQDLGRQQHLHEFCSRFILLGLPPLDLIIRLELFEGLAKAAEIQFL